MTALLMGCGNDRTKKVALKSHMEWIGELITLDMNPNCKADIICDLEKHPLPFEDEDFDELAAYDVLEHLGRQGDWRGWFDEFAEYWRILKPEGHFGIIVPQGTDADADPGHTRYITADWFRFLDQEFYDGEWAKGHQITDYRWYWKRSFKTLFAQPIGNHHLGVMLQKQ